MKGTLDIEGEKNGMVKRTGHRADGIYIANNFFSFFFLSIRMKITIIEF